MEWEFVYQSFAEIAVAYAPRLAGAIVVLIVGLQLIRWLGNWFNRFLEHRSLDVSLQSFLKSIVSVLLKILLILSVMGMIGIQMTSFIAILGAAGLAIGLALSGTLQNFAGGVIILAFKPFKVGQFISAQGHMGTVKEIQIFNTVMHTPDNKQIVIPNGGLSNSSLTNFSALETRRVDWTFSISYGDSYDKAKEVLLKLLTNDERVLSDPPPFIALSEMADSSINITTRAWVKASDYWPLFWEMNERVYKTFPQEGLSIPFPQVDVHIQTPS